jgi:hypothetical protein
MLEYGSIGVLGLNSLLQTPLLQRFVVEAKPDQFIDMRFLDILEKSALLKELYP